MNGDWYKIISEALRVLGAIIIAARPSSAEGDMFVGSFNYTPLVPVIYAALIPRLEMLDIDQEIKECSIQTVGKLISHFGDALTSEMHTVMTLLRRRLDNEITRIPTLRAICTIASSPLQLDLSGFVTESIVEISCYVRQQNRILKQTTLQVIDALALHNSASMPPELAAIVLKEVSYLLSDSDLALTHLALRTVIDLYSKIPAAAEVSIQIRAKCSFATLFSYGL